MSLIFNLYEELVEAPIFKWKGIEEPNTKWAKYQSAFFRSYVFMEKFKLAQNKKFTEAATDM